MGAIFLPAFLQPCGPTRQKPRQKPLLWKSQKNPDEVDAFRTTARDLADKQAMTDVSLYLFRDSRLDRMGEIAYNVLFFDTPSGQKSVVRGVNDITDDREMEIPKALNIVLRSFALDGADLPAYSLADHFFAMNDGTDGAVAMFDGFYKGVYDGDSYESDYIRIEGLSTGDIRVETKKDQAIWPEWTGSDTAKDIAGGAYRLIDGKWTLLSGAEISFAEGLIAA